ncbi:MAG: ComEC/Rec2 family competence protein [Chthoniobacteraceae bacterium]
MSSPRAMFAAPAFMPARIITFDVEHGNCHAVIAGGELVVIDLGESASFSPLQWLWDQGYRSINQLILSHPHADHIRALPKLWATASLLYAPRPPSHLLLELDDLLWRSWHRLLDAYNVPVPDPSSHLQSPGRAPSLINVRVFSAGTGSANLNNHSLVTVVDYFEFRMVFPGDLEAAGWKVLLAMPSSLSAIAGANVLVASHHGRQAGWHIELFRYIAPQLIIVSDGSCTETSYVCSHCERASGALVRAWNTGIVETRKVVSTRDNGSVMIDAFVKSEPQLFGPDLYPVYYTATVLQN